MFLRVRLIKSFFLLALLISILRLAYWQIYKGKELSAKARNQYISNTKIFAKRGEIFSSDGSLLAATVRGWSVYGEPNNLKESPKRIAEKIAPILVKDLDDKETIRKEIERIESLLSKDNLVWVLIKDRVDETTKEEIHSLNISGINFEEGERRVYPESSSSAHLLGFVGKDSEGEDVGYFGLEGYYNLILSGKSGFVRQEIDASGLPIILGKRISRDATPGVSLQISIDKRIQFILEKKIKEGIEKYSAKGGLGVIMDPKTGAIYAMASYPNFDPETYWKYSDVLFTNPVISSTFEPGSIFKILVMAWALDSKVVDLDTICDICHGPVKIGKYTIETWNKVYHPNSSMVDVIVNSDNVGMVFVTKRLGVDRLYEYLKKFYFGEKTGIDLQGEISSSLREKNKWSEIDLATVGFGQGIAVTPIQMLTATNAIANKGVMVKPRVVERLIGENWVEDIKPEVVGRVISEDAARKVTLMMVEAAKKGESKWTNIPGFKVAGKTGTAQIPIEGHYDEEKTIASFVGFAPYDKPKFTMLVTLYEPQFSPWASETAAPLWYSIAKELFDIFKIQPE